MLTFAKMRVSRPAELFSCHREMNTSGRVVLSLLTLLNFYSQVTSTGEFPSRYVKILSKEGQIAIGSNGVQSNDHVAESSKRAAMWLLDRRNNEWHWGRLLNSPVLLALSQSEIFDSSLPEFQLAIKQVDVDFLFDRLRHGELELYSDRLIPLAVTLTSLCRSPAHYYDYDLLDGLLDYRRKTSNFTFAAEMLAVCGGDGVIQRAHIRRLVRLLNPKMWTGPSISPDTLTMVLMATGCVAEHYNQPYLLPYADEIAGILIRKQEQSGSFGNGNLVTTALVIQALQMNGLSANVNRTIQASIHWLMSNQMNDGSFDSNLMATSEALMALSLKGGRSYIHMSHCDHHVPIQFLIWIGDQPLVERHSFNLEVPVDSTVYEALQLAQSQGLLRFETSEYSFGHYITSINNISKVHDSTITKSWVIYVLPLGDLVHGSVDARHLMSKSVCSNKIESGDRIVFWYRSPLSFST